jgi:hypothetical protein
MTPVKCLIEIPAGAGQFRFQLHGLPEMAYGFIEHSLGGQHSAQIVVGLRVVRLQNQRLLVL